MELNCSHRVRAPLAVADGDLVRLRLGVDGVEETVMGVLLRVLSRHR